MAIYDIDGNIISTGGTGGTSQSELQRNFGVKQIIGRFYSRLRNTRWRNHPISV